MVLPIKVCHCGKAEQRQPQRRQGQETAETAVFQAEEQQQERRQRQNQDEPEKAVTRDTDGKIGSAARQEAQPWEAQPRPAGHFQKTVSWAFLSVMRQEDGQQVEEQRNGQQQTGGEYLGVAHVLQRGPVVQVNPVFIFPDLQEDGKGA